MTMVLSMAAISAPMVVTLSTIHLYSTFPSAAFFEDTSTFILFMVFNTRSQNLLHSRELVGVDPPQAHLLDKFRPKRSISPYDQLKITLREL